MKPLLLLPVLCALALLPSGTAHAIPILQLYVEGAEYDSVSETWVLNTSNGSFKLWAIGNTAGSGSKGNILDVKLAAAFNAQQPAPTITLTSTTTDLLGPNGDTSVPHDPMQALDPGTGPGPYFDPILHTDGSAPVLGDGSDLSEHGVYGDGTDWWEFSLGDFTKNDSPLADFNGSSLFPSDFEDNAAQINVYDVSVNGLADGGTIHFDLYNHVEAKNHSKYVFAPFSHDGEGGGGDPDDPVDPPVVPEPSSMALLGLGVLGALARSQLRHSTRPIAEV